jgi:hypothetical protein
LCALIEPFEAWLIVEAAALSLATDYAWSSGVSYDHILHHASTLYMLSLPICHHKPAFKLSKVIVCNRLLVFRYDDLSEKAMYVWKIVR